MAADTGNHRVLIWHTVPPTTSSPATWCSASRTRRARGPGGRREQHTHRDVPANRGSRARRHARGGRRVAPPDPDLRSSPDLRQCGARSDPRTAGSRQRPAEPREGLQCRIFVLAVRDSCRRRPVLRSRHRQPRGARLVRRHPDVADGRARSRPWSAGRLPSGGEPGWAGRAEKFPLAARHLRDIGEDAGRRRQQQPRAGMATTPDRRPTGGSAAGAVRLHEVHRTALRPPARRPDAFYLRRRKTTAARWPLRTPPTIEFCGGPTCRRAMDNSVGGPIDSLPDAVLGQPNFAGTARTTGRRSPTIHCAGRTGCRSPGTG